MEWIPILISLAALGLSAFSVWRSVRATPRPRLEVKVDLDDEPSSAWDAEGDSLVTVFYINVTVHNRANGAAHDVRTSIAGRERELGVIAGGESTVCHYPLGYGGVGKSGTVTLSWWEYPANKQSTKLHPY